MKSRIFQCAFALLMLTCVQAEELKLRVVRAEAESPTRIRLTVTVTNRDGTAVHALLAEAFQAKVSGVPVSIELADRASLKGDDGLAVAIIIDASGSTRGGVVQNAKDGAEKLIQRMRKEDEICVLRAGTSPSVTVGLTNDHAAAIKAIRDLQTGGQTALLDAIVNASTELNGTKLVRRAIVLFTDGWENASRNTHEQVKNSLNAADVSLNLILFGSKADASLKPIAEESGGSVWQVSKSEELVKLYAELAEDLTTAYVLEFDIPETQEGAASIALSVTTPDGSANTSASVLIPVPLVGTVDGFSLDWQKVGIGVLALLNLLLALILIQRKWRAKTRRDNKAIR